MDNWTLIRWDDDNVLKKAMMLKSEWAAKARTAKNDMKQAGGRECEESRVEDQGSCRSNEMEEGVKAIAKGMRMHPATFDDEEKSGLKLEMMMMHNKSLG